MAMTNTAKKETIIKMIIRNLEAKEAIDKEIQNLIKQLKQLNETENGKRKILS